MNKTCLIFAISLLFLIGIAGTAGAAKVPAPDKGDGFAAVTLAQAQKLAQEGVVIVACHSHTTDFMKGHPEGTIHITCLVPKAHKKTDLPLDQVDFDVAQLPRDKNTPIMTYCASST